MVLPETFAIAAFLLILSFACFGLWPHIFKRVAATWQFELFSMDVAIGAVLLSVVAAYTLGSRGSDLGFADNMLVAGQRAEAVAFLSGAAFALGVICYLGSIALAGLANASLLIFSVFGITVASFYFEKHFFLTSVVAFVLWCLAAVLAIMSAAAGRRAVTIKPPVRQPGVRKTVQRRELSVAAKAAILGLLGGLSFGGTFPLIAMAQPEQLGIGAYGGVLLASLGMLLATLGLDFFFLNISLEGKKAGYGAFFAAPWKQHIPGILAGAVCAAGALLLFVAYTGSAGVTRLQVWTVPFTGGLLAVATSLSFLRAKNLVLSGLAAFVIGTVVFLVGFR